MSPMCCVLYLTSACHRKESLICCLSESLYFGSKFISAVVGEVLFTVRGVLTLLATGAPPNVVYVPYVLPFVIVFSRCLTHKHT